MAKKKASKVKKKMSCPLTDLKTILYSTDGSKCSKAALKEVLGLADACSAKIHAVSIVEANKEFQAYAPDLIEKEGKRAWRMLTRVKAAVEKEGLSCEIHLHTGPDPSEFILDDAKKLNADMIVMGKHGVKKGLRKLFLGSVTSKVLNEAPCSVLVVRT